MKKFCVTLFALVVTMFPITTSHAAVQTVTSMPTIECSWWSDSRDYDYYDDSDEEEDEQSQEEEEL